MVNHHFIYSVNNLFWMQAMQHGIIGLNIISFGYLPKTNSTDDIRAAQRARDFNIGW